MTAKANPSQWEGNVLLWLAIALLLLVPVAKKITAGKPKTTAQMFSTIATETKKNYADIHTQSYGWTASTLGLKGITANGVDYKVSPLLTPTNYYLLTDSSSPVNSGGWKFSRHLIQPAGNVDKIINLILPVMRQNGYEVEHSTPYLHFAKLDKACDYAHLDTTSSFSCYTQEDSNTAALNVRFMVGGYKQANPNEAVGDMTFGPMVVKSQYAAGVLGPTHVAGYDIAEAINTVQDKQYFVLYLRKDKGQWIYISRAADEKSFPCSDFMVTEEVRKVMNNQVCVNDQGLVRLDTTNPVNLDD